MAEVNDEITVEGRKGRVDAVGRDTFDIVFDDGNSPDHMFKVPLEQVVDGKVLPPPSAEDSVPPETKASGKATAKTKKATAKKSAAKK